MPADVLVVNPAVLGAVLWADLGTREITWRRVLRPVIVAAIAVAPLVESPQTSGNGLALELVGLASGLILGGIGSHLLMAIRKDARTDKRISIAGAGYATPDWGKSARAPEHSAGERDESGASQPPVQAGKQQRCRRRSRCCCRTMQPPGGASVENPEGVEAEPASVARMILLVVVLRLARAGTRGPGRMVDILAVRPAPLANSGGVGNRKFVAASAAGG